MTMLTTEKAAAYLGLAVATLEAWRVRGGGPVFRKLGRAVRYRQEDLETFLNARSRTSTSETSR